MCAENRIQNDPRQHPSRNALKFCVAAVLGFGGAVAFTSPARASLLLNDNFSSSSLNPASYPSVTSTSTGYDIASTKAATSSIGTGHLVVSMPSTTSGVAEAQALFASSPVTLANTGDYIDLTLTFTDTGILSGTAGAASSLYMGLYNSNGTAPVSGLQSSGLNTTAASTFATGGTQLWQGDVSQVGFTGGSVKTVTRPQQNGGANTTSAHQDLVANNSGGGTYNDPAGTQVGSSAVSALTLTSGQQYTEDLRITLTATGFQTDTNIYSGADTTGLNVLSQTATSTTPLSSNSFDGLAFGWRESAATGNGVATSMDVSSVAVATNVVAIPEPASLGLIAVSGLALIRRRRRHRGA